MHDFKIKIHKQENDSYQITILDCPIANHVGEFFMLTGEQIARELKVWQKDILPNPQQTTEDCGSINHLISALKTFDPQLLTLEVVQSYLDQIITEAVDMLDPACRGDTSAVIRAYGLLLFNLFFRRAQNPPTDTTLKDRYRASVWAANKRLRLKLGIESPELHNLHWECLYDLKNPWAQPFLGLSNHTFVIRGVPVESASTLSVEGPLRVLTVFANPRTRKYPDLADEIKQEKYNLKNLEEETQGRLKFSFLDELNLEHRGTFNRIVEAMTREKPHLLYYFGHGDIDEQGGFLVGERDPSHPTNSPVDKIYGDRLVIGLLGEANEHLGLVMLNACRLAQHPGIQYQWGTGAFSDIASSLLRMGQSGRSNIAAVIAMRFNIGADTARIFTRELLVDFSNSLWGSLYQTGDTLEEILVKARLKVFNAGNIEWLIPVLFSRSKDGRIFKLKKNPHEIFDEAKKAYLERDYAEVQRLLHEELQEFPQSTLDTLR